MRKKNIIISCICAIAILFTVGLIIFLNSSNKSQDIRNDVENNTVDNDTVSDDVSGDIANNEETDENYFYDERTGKRFEISDGNIKVYLPTKLKFKSAEADFSNEATYDEKNRLTNFKGFKTIFEGSQNPDFYVWDVKYIYGLDNHFDRMYEIHCSNKNDYSFEYDGDSIVKVINDLQFDKTYSLYNKNGMFIEDNYINKNTISYGGDNLISAIEKKDSDTMTYEYAYDQDKKFEEMVASGESDRGYVHYDNSIKRDNNHIISYKHGFNYEIDDMNELYLIYDFTYEDDKLVRVTIDDAGKKDDGLTYKYNENGVLSSISKKDKREKNKQLDYVFTYDNDQITEINLNNGEEILSIEYQVAYIDMDSWDSFYKDYYYSVRYEVLHDIVDDMVNAQYNNSPFIFEFTEGYLDQTIQYDSFWYYYDSLYGWITLPHVINEDFYSR